MIEKNQYIIYVWTQKFSTIMLNYRYIVIDGPIVNFLIPPFDLVQNCPLQHSSCTNPYIFKVHSKVSY